MRSDRSLMGEFLVQQDIELMFTFRGIRHKFQEMDEEIESLRQEVKELKAELEKVKAEKVNSEQVEKKSENKEPIHYNPYFCKSREDFIRMADKALVEDHLLDVMCQRSWRFD